MTFFLLCSFRAFKANALYKTCKIDRVLRLGQIFFCQKIEGLAKIGLFGPYFEKDGTFFP